jgi:hypothetical protein
VLRAVIPRRLRPPRDRPWEQGRAHTDPGYRRHWVAGRVKGSVAHDFWFADERCEEPLVLFHHIPKTAGTAIRHLLHLNYGEGEAEVVAVPRRASPRWFAELKASLGPRYDRLCAVAGHAANYLLPLLDGRPAAACTIIREPVDRVLSRYYFLHPLPSWTLAELYTGQKRKQLPAFYSGQARSLLEPLIDTAGIPPTADDPAADVWRGRLAQALEAYRVVGVQDRFEETVDALAVLPGFEHREIFRVRINRDRPPPSRLDPDTVSLIRRHNWLDEELYRLANERLDAVSR